MADDEAPIFATDGFAEVQPYFGPTDELDAGSVWRIEKIKDFQWRAKCMGIQDNPEIRAILNEMIRETNQLEEMVQEEKSEGKKKHWWCDGEYDDERAEEHNDKGTDCYKLSEYKDAFDHYTEAIRLSPSKAVYHSNRAAAALKLGRHKVAAMDGDYAIKQDPANLRAHLRAAQGHLMSGTAERSVEIYNAALELDPTNKTAQDGLKEAKTTAAAKAAAQAAEQASALRGERPPLPLHPVCEADAADLLISADEMLKNNPDREACKCARVEALIHCRRYEDAEEMCDELLTNSVDALYLKAELQWRMNQIPEAMAILEQALAVKGDSAKCLVMQERLIAIKSHLEAGEDFFDGGKYHDAVEAFNLALASDPSKASRFTACVLQKRAAATYECTRTDDALRDLTHALMLEPSHVQSLILRAQIFKEQGKMEECFLDLRRAQTYAPEMPGLWEGLADAAERCMRRRDGEDGEVQVEGVSEAEYYKLLDISSKATPKEVTRAYRKLAAKWHPDKWSVSSEKRQKAAEAMFKKVKDAYDTLKDPEKRHAYNQQSSRH
mmetsp:Transcript_7790/g.14742  ORF Transcript_7790/g.14742 Transcript_7790/m.14742 type:complete len:553 (+) Transcript_7790:139-1797(+)|eukprot:CAMPEP_0114238210 /NCGR_PEP_ID=MMETSP0058-20121206/7803_1 /TAXON_ID=36894 /ORGANISM="Pyramimonas parkeae, CCMP726" /LENGTH=552 /DNA_ID=CAMNT_0001350305 /DNA_START=66 /DNA_END=1724 /DNA_ORIENTATION=-